MSYTSFLSDNATGIGVEPQIDLGGTSEMAKASAIRLKGREKIVEPHKSREEIQPDK